MKRTLIFSLALIALAGCARPNPVLDIEGGKIQGVYTGENGVYVYKGIPYAAPPIRELRWKEPQPVIPWEGVRMADRYGHPGYQVVHYPGGYTTEWGYGDEPAYSEDCLYLNVWTKAPGQPEKKLPVAMFIHGGGLREGWGFEPEFEGAEWGAKDVVLVTINYRLGMFGFMSHPDLIAENEHGTSGNYGILDQIQALKWIKANIAQFGGDPDNVMIFGQSGGGRSVRTLSESPLARGLFHKAVIMSANGLATPNPDPAVLRIPTPTLDEQAAKYKEVMDWAGFDSLEKMRAASTEEIFSVVDIYNRVHGLPPVAMFAPTIDGYVCKQTFDEAALSGNLADVPYMIGCTSGDYGRMPEGIALFCKAMEAQGRKAYAYQFARPLPTDGRENVLSGAFHSSDLWFVFKTLKYCWRPWTQGDWDLSEKMITAWSNFAKNSEPGICWEPWTTENPGFMVFKLDENDAEASAFGEPM